MKFFSKNFISLPETLHFVMEKAVGFKYHESKNSTMLDQNYFQQLTDKLTLKGYSPKTIKVYSYFINQFFKTTNKTPESITKADIENYLLTLINKNYYTATVRLNGA